MASLMSYFQSLECEPSIETDISTQEIKVASIDSISQFLTLAEESTIVNMTTKLFGNSSTANDVLLLPPLIDIGIAPPITSITGAILLQSVMNRYYPYIVPARLL